MFLLIDKPKGITSHDVIAKLRKITGETKIGHAGTLDPNATGLLIVGVGRESTRKLGILAKETDKTYEAEVLLGEERDTLDAEGSVISRAKTALAPPTSEVEKTLLSFKGRQEQVPPQFSAIKVKGKKAYEIARSGGQVKLGRRTINIKKIHLKKYSYPLLQITCEVSSGTYIRALARDIGKALGVGAFLKNLRRARIGKYSVKSAVKLASLTKENWKKSTIAL